MFRVLSQVEEGDSAAVQAQQRDGHHVHLTLVGEDHHVVMAPGTPAIRGDASGEVCGRVIPSPAGEMGVDEEHPPILELTEGALGVPGVARARREEARLDEPLFLNHRGQGPLSRRPQGTHAGCR